MSRADAPLTVDACVWIAAFDPTDRFHRDSVAFLRDVSRQAIPLRAPDFLLLEACCALARRFRKPKSGEAAMERLRSNPILTLHPVRAELLQLAAARGRALFLRSADALYAAVADQAGGRLISWDAELVERAGASTPTDWLAED